KQNPNYTKSLYPGMQMLEQDLHDQSGGGEASQPGSKMDLEGILDNLTGIDVMENTLWHMRWQMTLRESLRRLICIKSEAMTGGPEAMDCRQWVKDQGVPAEAIDQIMVDDCMAVRPIGNGSPQARLFTLDRMEKVVPFMDDTGRRRYARDFTTALPGTSIEHA